MKSILDNPSLNTAEKASSIRRYCETAPINRLSGADREFVDYVKALAGSPDAVFISTAGLIYKELETKHALGDEMRMQLARLNAITKTGSDGGMSPPSSQHLQIPSKKNNKSKYPCARCCYCCFYPTCVFWKYSCIMFAIIVLIFYAATGLHWLFSKWW